MTTTPEDQDNRPYQDYMTMGRTPWVVVLKDTTTNTTKQVFINTTSDIGKAPCVM